MARSKWKLPIVNILNKNFGKKDIMKCSRNSIILEQFINKTVQVYNGKTFKEFQITEKMVGKKFGEFSNTRLLLPNIHTKQKKKKKKKN